MTKFYVDVTRAILSYLSQDTTYCVLLLHIIVDDQPPPSFLWRMSSGAIGGVYNAATGAAGMGYNTTKWVLGRYS